VSAASLATAVGPHDHVTGPKNPTLTLVEYGDYECPYCGQAFPIVEKIREHFREDLQFVFRNFPLTDVHPHAEAAAEFAEAAGLQGKFWEMHDTLFQHQRHLDNDSLLRYVTDVGADVDEVTRALAAGDVRRRVEADFESAIRSGANGTPAFFVNGTRYDGSWAYEPFVAYLEGLLATS